MTQKQTDLAFELAENWINGNRSDVIKAIEAQTDPIVASAICFQVASCLWRDGGLDNSDFANAIDRLAGER